MTEEHTPMKLRSLLVSSILILAASCSQQAEEGVTTEANPETPAEITGKTLKVTAYEFDAARGRVLFVSRNCVLCHSVNGVGGRAAYSLDKETFLSEIDPVNFSARMWRGAPEMIKLQQMELGYQINLGAQDIADLAAFAGDPDEQRKLTMDQVPEDKQASFLNEFIWVDEEYDFGEEIEN